MAERTLVLKSNYDKERSAQILLVVEKELAAARRDIAAKEKEKEEMSRKMTMSEKEGAVNLSHLHSEIQKLQFAAAAGGSSGTGEGEGGGFGGGAESSDMLQKLYQTHLCEVELLNKQIEHLESQVNLKDKSLDTSNKQHELLLTSKDEKIEQLQNEILQSEVKRQISIKNIEGALNAQSMHLDEERDNAVFEETQRMEIILQKAVLQERMRGEALLEEALENQKMMIEHETNEILVKEKDKFGIAITNKGTELRRKSESERLKAIKEEREEQAMVLTNALKQQQAVHDAMVASLLKTQNELLEAAMNHTAMLNEPAPVGRSEADFEEDFKKEKERSARALADAIRDEKARSEMLIIEAIAKDREDQKTNSKQSYDQERDEAFKTERNRLIQQSEEVLRQEQTRLAAESAEAFKREQQRCTKALQEAIKEEKSRLEGVIEEALANEKALAKKHLKESLKHQSVQDETARLLALEVRGHCVCVCQCVCLCDRE
jgi:hypothetical protein